MKVIERGRIVIVCMFWIVGTGALQAQSVNAERLRHIETPGLSFTPSGASFAPVVTYDSGDYGAYAIAVADVNRDGIPDLIVADCGVTADYCGTEEGAIGVLLGNGDGTFQAAVDYKTVAYGASSVAVADLNGDGFPDIVVMDLNGATNPDGFLSVLLGNGDGTFQPAVTYDSGGFAPISLAIADVNEDGTPDLLLLEACNNTQCSSGVVKILRGNGDGTFQAPVGYNVMNAAGGVGTLAVADVNGDGIPDLVVSTCSVSNCAGTVTVLAGNGDGTFKSGVNYATGAFDNGNVAVADINGDGIPDLVVSDFCSDRSCNNGAVSILLGKGKGVFETAVTYPSGGFQSGQIVVADVNSDGIPDLIVMDCGNGSRGNKVCYTTHGYAGVLVGNGDGTFQPVVDFATGGDIPSGVAVADLNGDGKPDIVASNCLTTRGGSCGSSSLGLAGVLINTNTVERKASVTALTSSRNPSIAGQRVTFTAAVSSSTGTPQGTVSFFYGPTNLGDSPLDASGNAAFRISTLPAGVDSMTAVYSGDVILAPSTSSALEQKIEQASSTTTLTSSPNPSKLGQTVTFEATVAGQYGGTPSGAVTFKYGSHKVKVLLKAGVATVRTNKLTKGSHTIRATYSGDHNFKSSSGSVVQTVN